MTTYVILCLFNLMEPYRSLRIFFFYLYIKNDERLNLMTIFYYLYNNNQGENKPQNSPYLESATFDNP